MRDDWQSDLKWSAKTFLELVWPILQQRLGGRLIQIETSASLDMARTLDIEAGIDAWHIIDGTGVRGLASRMQVCPPPKLPYNTFTVRSKRDSGATTEYAKRLAAIQSNGQLLYPYFTAQGYTTQYRGDTNKLLSFGLTETKRLIEFIGPDTPTKRTTNAEFYIVKFTEIPTFIYSAP